MTLLASTSKLGTRRTSLQVRPSSYKPPVHLYRAALRLANLLAKRFADPYIYHVQRHLAVRYVRRWDEAEEDRLEGLEKAAKGKKKDVDQGSQPFNRTIDTEDAAKASTCLVQLPPSLASAENSHTIPLDQHRPFKRLKAHLNLLRRAEQGHPEAVVKVLDSTYARNGLLRWASLRPFLRPHEMSGPSPALLALLHNGLTCLVTSSTAAPLHSDSFTFPLPRPHKRGGHPHRKMDNKIRNAMAALVKKRLDKVRTPLSRAVVEQIEAKALISCASPSPSVDEDTHRPQSHRRQKIKREHQLGPLHPSRPNFERQKSRMWAFLLGRTPVFEAPETSISTLSSTPRVPSPTSRLYGSSEKLPTDDIGMLVEMWNQALELGSTVLDPASSTSSSQECTQDKDSPAKSSRPTALKFYLSPHALRGHNDPFGAPLPQAPSSTSPTSSSATGPTSRRTQPVLTGITTTRMGSEGYVSNDEARWARLK